MPIAERWCCRVPCGSKRFRAFRPQECCMTDVKGFFYPRTASGRSSLIPSPPWYYSGDLLTVEYRTDPTRVAELLPVPLSLADEDPGAVALIWADWQSCSSSREELLHRVDTGSDLLETLLKVITETHADLLVVGTREPVRGRRYLAGSVSHYCI